MNLFTETDPIIVILVTLVIGLTYIIGFIAGYYHAEFREEKREDWIDKILSIKHRKRGPRSS